ncbi:MAG: DUF3568 family protein [Desulfobacteraceae bacterium]|nr:MAG: DUF3568 family protein [Desulfobacteraceae bacterium]
MTRGSGRLERRLKHMRMVRYLAVIPLLLLMAGCGTLVIFGAGTAAGVAGFKYLNGTLEVVYEYPFIETWDASNKALAELGITITDSKHDLTGGKIEGTRADGQAVKLSLTYKSPKETEVVIRVGIMGDEGASMAIKDRIAVLLMRK